MKIMTLKKITFLLLSVFLFTSCGNYSKSENKAKDTKQLTDDRPPRGDRPLRDDREPPEDGERPTIYDIIKPDGDKYMTVFSDAHLEKFKEEGYTIEEADLEEKISKLRKEVKRLEIRKISKKQKG